MTDALEVNIDELKAQIAAALGSAAATPEPSAN